MASLEELRALLVSAVKMTDELMAPLPPSGGPKVISAGTLLQPVLDSAEDGTTFLLEDGVYSGNLKFVKPVTLRSRSEALPGRVKKAFRPVVLQAKTTHTLLNYGLNFTGIGFGSDDPLQTIVTGTAERVTFDRCTILGDPVKGQRRGLLANGKTTTLLGCHIDDCRLPAKETQAVLGTDKTDTLLIDNCYLGGGSQSVMIGGADPSSEANIPQNIVIRRSTLSKNPAWYLENAQIKCALELKDCIGFIMQDSIFEYGGVAEGQAGYLMLFTPRNQGGTAPYSTVRNVLIERCTGRHGGGCVSMLGTDYVNTSGFLEGLIIRNVMFDDIDPHLVTGSSGRCFYFNNAPREVTLDGITINGSNLNSIGYFDKAPPVGLEIRNMKYPASKYPWKIDGGGQGIPAIQAYAPDAIIKISPTDIGAVGYPT